jgi:cation diffusion facilitator CzcD-associated flavoprotein CzcO
MASNGDRPETEQREEEHLDVLIVGAGLSGIGAACQLRRSHPHRTVALLESRGALGGTWDLFRYPGVRSDSDMFTLGYRFAPWKTPDAIADGGAIRDYIRRTAEEYRITDRIRYHHRVVGADWSSADARWTVTVERGGAGQTPERAVLTCSFLYCCSGYYRYDQGYLPDFPEIESYPGRVVHPQHWPEDLDCTGKRVVVIGSGATAVTLVPALAETAGRVTMLQRSPSYIATRPSRDRLGPAIVPLLPGDSAWSLARWGNLLVTLGLYQLSRRAPALARRMLTAGVRAQLPNGYDVERHFSPRYQPWDQRLCLAADGDLFRAIREDRAEVVTDRIERFTGKGIRLESGRELEADVVVTATGLNLLPLGGISLTVDGGPVRLPDTFAYRGLMLSGVPNFAFTIGYVNASWTLRADLVAEYVCRLLDHLDRTGRRAATPRVPPGTRARPYLELSSGYIARGIEVMPKQGEAAPWRVHQNYLVDRRRMRRAPVDDGHLEFSG